MIIEGENLETLKLLLSAYREQVKVIGGAEKSTKLYSRVIPT